jgi:hypothetical protein
MDATSRRLASLLLQVSAIVLTVRAADWPVVRASQETVTFTGLGAREADTPFASSIRDREGRAAYRLECHNGNFDGDSAFSFSGDFQCALFAVKGSQRASWNLLAANTKNERSTDWWNRGRMLSAQLRGECLKYPEYSTLRHFRLRGMLLTLGFTGTRWSGNADRQNNPLLEEFTFTFSVAPDASARSSTSEEPGGPRPPESCYP